MNNQTTLNFSCPKCGSFYELARDELHNAEANAKCSQCGSWLIIRTNPDAPNKIIVQIDDQSDWIRNIDPEFVGIEELKRKQKWQLDKFEEWAATGNWEMIHGSHYDWWMFPISSPSKFGFGWSVFEEEINELKKDENYIRNYLRGVELLALSWGWDAKKAGYIPDPTPSQCWHNWPIRLYKVARSLAIFGFNDYYQSMRKYAQDLIKQKVKMTYGGSDLGVYFQ